MIKKIQYGKQYLDNNDIRSVKNALKSKFISSGNTIKKFEKNLKNKLKVKYTLVCSSGTAALHLAFQSINVKKDDIILIPAITFIASFSLAKMMGAKVYLVDVDSVTGQMTPESLKNCIKKNKIKKVKAIITMYMGGAPMHVVDFFKIKKKLKCFLIEDACHALGAKYKDNKVSRPIGCCKHSDICTFSLHPLKSITTGEGGIISTNNSAINYKIALLRSHGIKRSTKKYWEYKIDFLGMNYRLSDINCGLGISQLKKINRFMINRTNIANKYLKLLKDLKNYVDVPVINKSILSSWHLFIISINFNKLSANKDKFIKFMNKKGIFPQYHYIPIYRFKVYNLQQKNSFSNSKYYFKNNISLPIYFKLSFKNVEYIVMNIKKFINLWKK